MASIMVYCFIDGGWMGDVAVIAVCGACGDVIGSHVSSNDDWAKHDITREYHQNEYRAHMAERHDAADCVTEWVNDPASHAAVQELRRQIEQDNAARNEDEKDMAQIAREWSEYDRDPPGS